MQKRETRRFRTAIVAITALLAIEATLSPSPAGAQGAPPNWPPELKNLKVFPPETDARELIDKMKGFTADLGVRCQFCHVGEEGHPIFSFDFASDEKPEKKAARVMLRMVEAINKDHLSKLEGDESTVAVRCVTCHHGTARPEQLHDLLVGVATTEGKESALAKYDELRRKYYGGQSYDFGEQTLVRTGGMLAAQEDLDAAVALIQLNLRHFPKSAMSFGALAQLHQRQGDTKGAIKAFQKVLEIDPKNTRVQSALQELQKAEETKQMEGAEGEPEEGSGEASGNEPEDGPQEGAENESKEPGE